MAEKSTKIFFLIPSLTQGGAERQVLELIRRLPARFQPVLALFHDDVYYRDLLPAGQPRYVLGANKMSRSTFAQLVSILRKERPTIFQGFLNQASFWGRLAALRAGVPVILGACRARMIEPQYLAFESLLCRLTGGVLTNSVGVEHELRTLAGVPAHKIHVVPNFLDLETFRPPTDQERRAARLQWGLGAEQRVMLMPGRICLQKHQPGLLLAIEQLVACGAIANDDVLLLAGRLKGGTVAPLVERMVQRPPLSSHVRLLGSQRDIRSLYWAADLLVMPSLWEGLPNAVLEGCACGLPAVVSHAANVDGIVDPQRTGFENITADRQDLIHALRTALALDRAAWREMGQRARQRMEQRYHPDGVLRQMTSLYDSLAA
ncbi:MAG: glycosyltransferase [Deltaproteobacteria bacterium]|nr:glycosyltransferase [Deltaproteobacteria bacterium]